MERIKYQIQVTGIGPSALEFKEENMLVLFKEGAPGELLEFSIAHSVMVDLARNIEVGDKFVIDETEYVVTSVGDVANKTLFELGHATLKFDGAKSAQLPGYIHLFPDSFPRIKVGSRILIR
jgi:PTS system glucitol/sorbitol-specific IIA component